MTENDTAREVVDAAYHIHRALGPGLLESVYEVILAHELTKRGLSVRRQVAIPLVFEGKKFDEGFRADLIVNDHLIVEIKSVEQVLPVHKKLKLGLLINFNAALIKDGIFRVANGIKD